MNVSLERIHGICLAAAGLGFGLAVLSHGYGRADDIAFERELCSKTGICATTTLNERARNLLWSGQEEGPEQAVALYRETLVGDPSDPESWANLGEALDLAGDAGGSKIAFDTAVQRAPNRPEVLMQAAHRAFTNGEVEFAASLARRILTLVRDYDQVLFRFLRLSGLSVQEALAQAIPEQREPLAAYLAVLIRGDGSETAQQAWNRMQQLELIEQADLGPYIAALLKDGRTDAAVETQRAYVGDQQPAWPASSLVFNGGFEREPLGTPLDWTIRPHKSVETSMDGEEKAEGDRSLRITFLGGKTSCTGT